MANRQNNQLPNNLPQLQNLIKRDPESYKEEFVQQLRFFESTLQVFELDPSAYNKSLDEHVMFLSQVAKCYPEELSLFPQKLVEILRRHSTVLHSDMRLSLCKALILLRHKNLLAPTDLLQLFFDLLKCQDKALRTFLREHIVTDLKNVNAKQKDVRLNTSMQNFMYTMLKDAHHVAAKTALDIMAELYRKNVWHDAKTVNVIRNACLRERKEITKLTPMVLKFFLGSDDPDDANKDDDDDDDDTPAVKDVKMANKVNKKTRKRQKFLEEVKKAHKRKKNKSKAESFNFSALHLIHDPQKFAEELFDCWKDSKEKFDVNLMLIELISRLIGTHQLFVLDFYEKIAKYLRPHQREVIKLLQFSAQAAHELVPHDEISHVVSAIANNFITERNTGEVIAIGINAMKELCKRCPLALDDTLLRDLAEYKTYKDKAVMMAARSLIGFYRQIQPELLHKKDRGRPTEAVVEAGKLQYGNMDAKDFIPGAEAVVDVQEGDGDVDGGQQQSSSRKRKRSETDDEDEDSDGWEDVVHSSDDEAEENEGGNNMTSLEERRAKASEVTVSRILTDADFKRIESAQLKKQVQGFSKSKNKKRKLDEERATPVKMSAGREELVDLANIEMVHKKRKHDKEARMASVLEGRKDREKFGSRKGKANEHASTTNKQKLKNKNFMMIKHNLKRKAKQSFVDKQKRLRQSMLRSRKFK